MYRTTVTVICDACGAEASHTTNDAPHSVPHSIQNFVGWNRTHFYGSTDRKIHGYAICPDCMKPWKDAYKAHSEKEELDLAELRRAEKANHDKFREYWDANPRPRLEDFIDVNALQAVGHDRVKE